MHVRIVLLLAGFLWCLSQGFGSVFILIRIQIQHFRLNTDPDPDPGFLWRKIEKNYSWKKKNFGSKNTIFLFFQGLHKRRPSYKRSLHLSKKNIQLFKTWNFLMSFFFYWSFLSSWFRIRIPNTDPDPLTWSETLVRCAGRLWWTTTCPWAHKTSSSARTPATRQYS